MTVQTAKRSLNGDSDNWLDHKVFLSEMQIINKNKVISNMRFGAFAIIVSVSISACAGDGTLMSVQELEYFEINCSKRAEQVAFLESQRPSAVDQQDSRLENFFKPWRLFTDKDGFVANRGIGSGQQEWVINQKLMRINSVCQGR
jgi:hypothetical protein